MSNQQFVKSPPTPADSELWKIGIKWRRSQTKNVDYTELDNIMTKHSDIDIQSLLEALDQQLAGKLKESIDYVNHLLVASYTPDGKTFVYGSTRDRKEEAEKKASFNTGKVPEGGVQTQQKQQQQLPIGRPTSGVLKSSPAVVTEQPKEVRYQRTIEVVTDVTPVKVGDISAIGEAEQRGLYVLPIIHVGNQRFCFEDKNGDYILLYGRIIKVEVGDN